MNARAFLRSMLSPSGSSRVKTIATLVILFGLLASASTPAHAELRWHWENHFSEREKAQLTDWIQQTYQAIETSVTPYPFDVHIYFHRLSGAKEPVPWASTRRSYRQGVDFHVDPSFSPSEFMNDWTAAHELSHLLIPFLGTENSWYAEGFASFMQYQVLHAMNLMSAKDLDQEYKRRLIKAKSRYKFNDIPFVLAAKKLRAQRKFPTLYWGGAAYFLQVDKALKAEGSSLLKTLRDYVVCCRRNSSELNALTQQLDRSSGTFIFSRELNRLNVQAGFPRH